MRYSPSPLRHHHRGGEKRNQRFAGIDVHPPEQASLSKGSWWEPVKGAGQVAGGEEDMNGRTGGARDVHRRPYVEGTTATGSAGEKRASRAGVRCRGRPPAPEIRAGPVGLTSARSGILLGRVFVVRLSAAAARGSGARSDAKAVDHRPKFSDILLASA